MVTIYESHLFSRIEEKKCTLELRSRQGYPVEKEIATHSSIFAWRILWTEESDRLLFMGLQRSDTTEQLSTVIPKGEFNWAFPWIIRDVKARQRPSPQGVYGLEKETFWT